MRCAAAERAISSSCPRVFYSRVYLSLDFENFSLPRAFLSPFLLFTKICEKNAENVNRLVKREKALYYFPDQINVVAFVRWRSRVNGTFVGFDDDEEDDDDSFFFFFFFSIFLEAAAGAKASSSTIE